MNINNQRKAFSMLTAILVIVVMSSISAFVLNLSGKTVKMTTAQFQQAQADLYAKSYSEFALLAVTGNNRSSHCLHDINGTIGDPLVGGGYRIRAHIDYIGTSPAALGVCSPVNIMAVATPSTPLTVIIDVYVDYKDPDDFSSHWFTIHRRTTQKI